MPSKSKAQLRYMRMCQHHPEHAKGDCPDMTDDQYKDFTHTSSKDLPERKSARHKRPVHYPKPK